MIIDWDQTAIVDCSYRAIRKFKGLREHFVQVGAEYSARIQWREIDTAFENRILTGTIINSRHIEPRQFLADANEIVLERARHYAET